MFQFDLPAVEAQAGHESWAKSDAAVTYWNGIIGDQEPRHIHVYAGKHRLIGRLDVDRMAGIEGWTPDRKLVKLVQDLINEGRL